METKKVRLVHSPDGGLMTPDGRFRVVKSGFAPSGGARGGSKHNGIRARWRVWDIRKAMPQRDHVLGLPAVVTTIEEWLEQERG